MDTRQRRAYLVSELQKIHKSDYSHPITREASRMLWCFVSGPYAQWDYPHITTNKGGIVRFSVDYLIEKLEQQIKGETI